MCDIFNLVHDDLTSDGGVLKKGFVLVNDDDNVFGSISPSSRRRTNASSSPASSSKDQSGGISSARYYYPFMHRTLETLDRSAASSAFLASSNDSKGKIIAIGSAVALGCFSRSYEKLQEGHVAVALDTKLLSLAVCNFSECLGSVLLGTVRAGASTSSATASLPQEILTTYRLNEPLDTNTENAQPDAATQSAAASSLSSSVSFSTYRLLSFIDDDKSNSAVAASLTETRSLQGAASLSLSSSEISNTAEIISLFIRAQIAEGGNEPPTSESSHVGGLVPTTYIYAISSLIQSLLEIVSCCYDFGPEMHFQGGGSVGGEDQSSNKKKSMTSKKKKRKADEFFTSVSEILGPEIRPR